LILAETPMRQKWSATLGADGQLQMPSEHLFELAAIVHGYSLDSVMMEEMISQPVEQNVSA
jgi:hypothetical protein